MKIGDPCICRFAKGEEPVDDLQARHFGVIEKIHEKLVTVQLFDGSKLWRGQGNVAVYLQTPPNWQELYQRQRMIRPASGQAKGNRSS